MVPNESDEHALEEALLLKERYGGRVTVLALDAPELDDVLLAALTKGADRAIKITGVPRGLTTSNAADVLASVIDSELGVSPADLILSGVQAIDDLDGLLAPLIACQLGLPFLGTVVGLSVEPDRSCAVATMEYPSGVRGEFEVTIPAVFGIRAAERPPRYVSIAKVRGAAKSHQVECILAPLPANVVAPVFDVLEMRKPQLSGRADMLEGSVEELSARLAEVLAGRGLL
jgi:electron transfer flavoprotein beta subunit